ncbi:MAG TPA: Type 1 glutamine amidotransferase-like domain-containing protein [Chloroflexota bacterium]|nr:Type 1 glutamine amidotransferase-like domain-containing protein [Chloroflexota bacterium]
MEEMAAGARSIGTVALVGAGEFLPAMEPVDRALLASLAAPARVVVLPTASAPDGPGVPERWARMGAEHFTRLGAEVRPLRLLTREDAERADLAEQIAWANVVYLSGGKPRYLLDTLAGTPAWQEIRRVYESGGVVAGCSAGAMVLGGELVDVPQVWHTRPALGLVPGVLVIPHFDEARSWIANLLGAMPHTATVVGVDGMTALVGHGGRYTASGRGGVTVITAGGKVRYLDGQSVALPG